MTSGVTKALIVLAALALNAQRGLVTQLPPGNGPQTPSPTHASVVYATTDGQKLRLDVYEPRKHNVPAPGIVLIHGGGFIEGDRSGMDDDAAELAHAGFVAFSIDYRLLQPHHRPVRNQWPAQLQDCQSAVRWIREHAAEYHVDPSKIGAYGHSAGGALAALLGLTDSTGPAESSSLSRAQAVVDLSGISDFTSDHDPEGDALFTALFGGTEAQVPAVWRDASPVYQVKPGDPPFLIVHGTRDQLVSIHQSEELEDALKKAGVTVKFLKVDDDHSLQNAVVRERILTQAAEFFRSALR